MDDYANILDDYLAGYAGHASKDLINDAMQTLYLAVAGKLRDQNGYVLPFQVADVLRDLSEDDLEAYLEGTAADIWFSPETDRLVSGGIVLALLYALERVPV